MFGKYKLTRDILRQREKENNLPVKWEQIDVGTSPAMSKENCKDARYLKEVSQIQKHVIQRELAREKEIDGEI